MKYNQESPGVHWPGWSERSGPIPDSSELLSRKRNRKSFWAVPWDGSVRHPNAPDDLGIGRANYLTYSIEHLSDDYEQDYDRAVDKGWIREGTSLDDIHRLSSSGHIDSYDDKRLLYKYHALRELVARSLYDSQMMRLLRNGENNSLSMVEDDLQLKLAAEGMAAPEEILATIENHPKLVSVELAKESHALRYDGADEINEYIYNMLSQRSMLVQDDRLEKYKKLFLDTEVPAAIVERKSTPFHEQDSIKHEIPAAVIERKKIVGLAEYKNELLVVAQRYRLMVRGDRDAVRFDEHFGRKVRNDSRQDELFSIVRGHLPYARDDDSDLRWLQPISTSYYAYYPSRVESGS